MFVVSIGHGDYLCSGSYIVQGEKYQIVGKCDEARKFKNKQSAQNWVDKLFWNRANINKPINIIELKSEIDERN